MASPSGTRADMHSVSAPWSPFFEMMKCNAGATKRMLSAYERGRALVVAMERFEVEPDVRDRAGRDGQVVALRPA